MEALISHLVTTVTTIREEQIRQGSALAHLQQGQRDMMVAIQSSSKGLSGSSQKWLLLLKPLFGASMKYAVGILTIGYVLRGGDLMTAAATLLELAKLLS